MNLMLKMLFPSRALQLASLLGPRYLLKVGANVNQPNAQGLTPLGAATQNRQEATMAVLKAHGAQ